MKRHAFNGISWFMLICTLGCHAETQKTDSKSPVFDVETEMAKIRDQLKAAPDSSIILKDSQGTIIFTAYANTFMLFPTTLGATIGQVTKGIEPTEPIDEDPLIKVRDDCRSCDDELNMLQTFEDLINASNISYHALGGPNSNSATNTALQRLGINWNPPFWAPGWGAPVPIKSR
jgi:hypothetical protein